jgi:hypothetical protein
MKKLVILLAIASLTASASTAFAGLAAHTGINGSLHDMNTINYATNDTYKRTCAFCHTPHNATTGGTVNAPLWNHKASTVALDPYAWASPLNQSITINVGDPLIGPSRLCMGCHDGVVAVDSHGTAGSAAGTGVMTTAFTDAMTGAATEKRYISDLTVTHPIGFTYDAAVAARNTAGDGNQLVPKGNGFIADGQSATLLSSTFDTNTRTGITSGTKKISDTLYAQGYVTCASCHDVHNSVNAKPVTAGAYNYFLYAQEEGSAICLSCHIK